jgi:class 3 adenylate cyclase
MLIKTHLKNTAIKSLCESMTVRTMEQLARELIPDYDLHRQFQFRESMSIPGINAATQIIDDICKASVFPEFVQLLIKAEQEGFKGRKYRIPYLGYILHGMQIHGYVFDNENNMFIEDSRVQSTLNWGVLREGVEYSMTFLQFDVSGNSKLVRCNPVKKVEKTYQDLLRIVNDAIAKRNGRLWSFQGDGGLAAFCFGKKDLKAVLSAVEILHELFLYNMLYCVLDSPLEVRFAVHAGKYTFSNNMESLKKSDAIKEIIDIESKYTNPGSITVSSLVYAHLDKRIADLFLQAKGKYMYTLYNYRFHLES